MDILEKLRSLDPISDPAVLPTEGDVKNAEEKLGVKFSPSYVKYQLEYSDIFFGQYELYRLFEDGSHLDLIKEVKEAREFNELQEHLLPFVQDNGDYFCFDLSSEGPEHEVVYWSHNGTTDERWNNFLDWVERCWIGEHEEDADDTDA